MRTFRYAVPDTLAEAVALMTEYGDEARPLSGGTGLIHFLKQDLVQPEVLVSLHRVAGLDALRISNGQLEAGAMVRHRRMETDPSVAQAIPLLAAAYGHVATVRIREMATVGGGLGQGDPAQDAPAVWATLGASVRVDGPAGPRSIPAHEFWLDYYTTALATGELVTALHAPLPPAGTGWSYQKFLPRSADDYAAVSVACLLGLDSAGRMRAVRVGIGSCAPTPVLAPGVGEMLEGQAPSAQLFARAAEAVREVVDPLDDVRGSADYKRDMAVVFTRRALAEAATRAMPATGGARGV